MTTARRTCKRELPALKMTRDYLDRLGWRCDVVERFIQTGAGGFAKDCFGFADLIAYHPDRPQSLALLQITSVGNHASRFRKILCSARAFELVCIGCRVGLASWAEHGMYAVKPRFKWFTRAMFERLPIGLSAPWSPVGGRWRDLRDAAAARMEALPVDGRALFWAEPAPRLRRRRELKKEEVLFV